VNTARAQKIASQNEQASKRLAQKVRSESGKGQVVDLESIRVTVGEMQKAAAAFQGEPGDNLQVALRIFARTAPEALDVISHAIHGAIKHINTGERADRYSASFHGALSRLSDHGVDLELTGRALQAWHLFCAETMPPEPIVEGTHDGGIRFAWNTDRAYLDAEVYRDGSVEWFFEDRDTSDTDGTVDERERQFPARFFEYMRRMNNLR
jgi:hypothetical protein